MHRFFPSHCESTQIALYHIIKQSKFSTWLVESQAKNEIKSRFHVKASSIGDTFPFKRAVKGRCGDFRSKAKKILPDLDCGSLSV